MTVTAPPLDLGGAELDAQIAVVQALLIKYTDTVYVGPANYLTADNAIITADAITITADATFAGSIVETVGVYPWYGSFEQLLAQLQTEAVDHYMVTGWLNAAAILAQYSPAPAWDVRGQELQARVTFLTALVASAPAAPPGNSSGYGAAGWTTVLSNYQQQLYEAQIQLVEHMMATPGGTTGATILANMTGSQSFPFNYGSQNAPTPLPPSPVVTPPVTPPPPPPPPPPSSHTVGGTLSGLTPGNFIVLRNNGGDDLTLNSDGAFVFATKVNVGDFFAVTVKTAPVGQPVVVQNGSGVVGSSDVTVQVSASPAALRHVGGTLSGLTGVVPIVLENASNGDTVSLSANGSFVFPTSLSAGRPYAVTVLSAPVGQNVTLTNATGVVSGSDITNIGVNAAPPATYSIGGTLSGLPAGGTIVLQNNGGDNLSLSANGSFAFATKIAGGGVYSVTVLTPPAGKQGILTNAAGTVGNANVTNVGVAVQAIPTFTVGGTISGLVAGGTVTLRNNGGDDLVLTANGSFNFGTPLAAGAAYAVTVLSPPAGGSAAVSNGSGLMPAANVTNVGVACTAPPVFSVGGTLSGLGGGASITLQNNGGDNLVLSANGAFTFATKLAAGTAYNVTVAVPPSGGSASVSNASGTMPSANVTNVGVVAAAPPTTYTIGGTLSGLVALDSLTLQNNAGDDLVLSANGPFTFATPLLSGAAYAVTVSVPPGSGSTSLANATGTVATANVTNVGVACVADPTHTVGGTLSGLSPGTSVVLQNNGGDDLTLTVNGAFTFVSPLAVGATYAVTVLTQPAGQTCNLANASGTIGAANVTNVGATCAGLPHYTVGGTLSGLQAGKSVVLQNNGADNLTLSANGAFTFVTPLLSGAAYAVTVLTAPAGETAAVSNGNGTVQGANVTTVSVACAAIVIPVRRFTPGIYTAISYAQSGLGTNPDTLSVDTGNYPAYAAGTAANPITIPSGPYSNGTVPGGHLGTGTSSGCFKGNGTGGHTLARKASTGVVATGPCVNSDATHRTVGVVMRYPWVDIEPTKDNYVWTRMDADLAQCIALGVQWFPLPVWKTFTAAEGPPGLSGDVVPPYLSAFRTLNPNATTTCIVWRWDLVNVNPRICALLAAIGARYDKCPNFAGVATQETATANADVLAHNWHSGDYLTALSAETDAYAVASPNSRQLIYQNFGGTEGDIAMDKYLAYAQKNGCIGAGPDLVIGGGSVYQSCFTSGSNSPAPHAGRYSGFRFGGTIGSGVNFKTTGPTGLAIQRAEWLGVGPATGPQSVQNAVEYLLGSTTVGQQPNFLSGQMCIIDWKQGTGGNTGIAQEFIPDGVNLVLNNAISRFDTWAVF